MSWTSVVRQYMNGDEVTAEVLNSPIAALTDRTQYLYDLLTETAYNTMLLALTQPISQPTEGSSGVVQYSVVYYDGEDASPGLKLAFPGLAELNSMPFFRGANSAHVFGIVRDEPGTDNRVTVCLQGVLTGDDIVGYLVDDTATKYPEFLCGPLYLSAVVEGKLTPIPNGLAIYVGYAKNRDEFYLNPNQEVLSELFWSFRYAVLDRPAGEISETDGEWTIAAAAANKVGWISATEKLTTGQLETMFPAGVPKYFYQLPDPLTVDAANTELSVYERTAAKNLRLALPTRPNTFSFLTVNGIVYSPRSTSDDDGCYALNELGLWWFADVLDPAFEDTEFNQPWAADLNQSLRVADNVAAGAISLLTADGEAITGLDTYDETGFAEGHLIQFTGTPPSGVAADTDYVVLDITATTFKIATVAAPTVAKSFTSTDTVWYVKWQPDFWVLGGKGGVARRPLMNLLVSKLNPDLRQNLVTTLQADPAVAAPAIQIKGYADNEPARTGDLKLNFNLAMTGVNADSSAVDGWNGSSAVNGNQAIKGMHYSSTLEQLQLAMGPVVSEIRSGGGLSVNTNTTTGVATIAVANAFANAITELEPEQARLEYYGLNSYLALDYTTTPNGFVGKFILPDQIVATGPGYLSLVMTLFGKTSATINKSLRFKFDYSIGKLNTALSSTVVSDSTVVIDLPLVSGTYAQYLPFETASSVFKIPVTALAGKAVVNFRIHRLKPTVTTGLYPDTIGMSGIYWVIS